MTQNTLALGVEAVGCAAFDAGIKGAFGYPGTPSTEGFEFVEAMIQEAPEGRVARWAANEKVAYDLALGVSYAGHRTLVTMKHVGLNVAMDAYANSALTGVRGGLVLLVADDPGMHSSQNEQDSRRLAEFAWLPCLEPSTVQECYDFTWQAFELSEALQIPVMVRLVTRLAHCRAALRRRAILPPTGLGLAPKDTIQDWVLIPSNARRRYVDLLAKQPRLIERLAPMNRLVAGGSRQGVAVSGMGRAYFDQLLLEYPALAALPRLEVAAYPVDPQLEAAFLAQVDEVFVFEEDYPVLEERLGLRGSAKVRGRLDGTVPRTGELTPRQLKNALALLVAEAKESITLDLPPRAPRFCDGCGHVDAYEAMQEALANLGVPETRVFGDIGCYTLAAQEPMGAIHAVVEMGASISMAVGAALAGQTPSVAVIGDSTFGHSGLPALLTAADSDVNVTIIILDNRVVGMTGQQPSQALDQVERMALGMGIPEAQLQVLTPLPRLHDANVKAMESALQHPGPSVVIFRRECIQSMRRGVLKDHDRELKACAEQVCASTEARP
ncbi:indolepyruvate oxidoreductase subunit IorA [Geothrix limicola]|uniref:Indolepyruvate oxidoreductase subunit IorA n=1 Tax=Geothrix limicola TaxID=2927978 RepID=A0ABQ5QH19_9BACT|nr:thiamine pyrophosphate-dependent enzyme [Geothrix limicola]GLH73665.1 indolepyruvate oxidoreductase subunit IorA [Geothrix limicola]